MCSQRFAPAVRRGLIVVALVTVLGCARMTSIHRTEAIPADSPHSIAIDAKQRMIFSRPLSHPDKTTGFALCAEAAPDAFSALAASAAVDVAAEALSGTLSESAATIERTQTVNILRELMYRTCERYLNGVMSREDFVVQAARDQQIIVQVLAIEQLTGAVRAQATALTTVAKSAADGISETTVSALVAAKADMKTTRTASDTATAEATALVPAGACPAKPYDTSTPPTGTTADQAKAKNESCAKASKAQVAATESETHYRTLLAAAGNHAGLTSESSGALAAATLTTAQEATAVVAHHVVEIVKQNHAFDEIGMACISKLRALPADGQLGSLCDRVLERMVVTRQIQLLSGEGLDLEKVAALMKEYETSAQSRAEIVWASWKTFESAKKGTFDAFLTSLGVSINATQRTRLMQAAAQGKSEFIDKFGRVDGSTQIALVKNAN